MRLSSTLRMAVTILYCKPVHETNPIVTRKPLTMCFAELDKHGKELFRCN